MNKTFHANRIHYNACVGFNGNYDIDTYALGYLESVRILTEATLKGKTTLDAIVYSILYSARHYIELTLKHQINSLKYLNQIVDSSFSYKLMAKHEISWLWIEFKKMAAVDKRYSNLVQKAEEYINDFSEIDDNGETFRYPYSNDNNKHLTQLHCIDIIDFGLRFQELSKVLDEIVWQTTLLMEEYVQKSFVCKRSRAEIEEIARKLPPIGNWNNKEFKELKGKIKLDYSLSSNQLSKIITFIKSHREFSGIIGNEIRIKELDVEHLKWFLSTYEDFLSGKKHYYHNFHIYLENTINKICRKLTKPCIASIAQIYEMGYFRLYSEEYDEGLNYKLKEPKTELVRNYLLGNGIVKENIFRGLQSMGQKTLLTAFN